MKAVLCLWAREHLKGRPGPGSGLALLERRRRRRRRERERESRKKAYNTLLCVCACVCVWQRAAQKKRERKEETGRLYPARLGREQTELSGATRDEGWKNWFSPARCWGSLLPSGCAAGGKPGRHDAPCRMESMRDTNEGRKTEDYEEQEEDFSSTWAAGGTLTWICWINTCASPGQVSYDLLVGGSFFSLGIFLYMLLHLLTGEKEKKKKCL